MANEISVTATLKAEKDEFDYKRTVSVTADMTTARGGNPGSQNIGTSAETVSAGDLTTPRWALFKNLDDTNYVEIGPDSSGLVPFIKLLPGEFAVLPLAAGVTIKAQANLAAVDLLVEILDA